MTTAEVPTRQAVLEALGEVLDPELDRDIVELGFVQTCVVDRGDVALELRLPTYWCAPTFSWLMASDARRAMLSVPGVERATVRLVGHHAEDEIASGVNGDLPFETAFTGQATGGLDALRRTFRSKAFLGRLERVLERVTDQAAGELRVRDLPDTPEVRAYLVVRAELGLDCSPEATAMTEPDGREIRDLTAFRRRARTVRVSVEANGAMCRALLAAREPKERPAG